MRSCHDCHCSPAVAALAYVALAYLFTCIGYLAVVHCGGVGSPFNDSLTPEQREIKKRSAHTRSRIFWGALLVSVLVLAVLRPLRR